MNIKQNAFVQYSQISAITKKPRIYAEQFAETEQTREKMLNMQDIVNTIFQQDRELANSKLKEINKSLVLRKLYNDALKDLSTFETELQIAADSTSISEIDFSDLTRKDIGYELKFVPANQAASDLFVILILDEPSSSHLTSGVSVHVKWQHQCNMIHLMHTSNGKFQTIIDESDQVFNACFDSTTQWFII